jgi:hypothetical protein
MVKNFKVDHVSEEVSRAFDHMNTEIAKISPPEKKHPERRPWMNLRVRKTPAERREQHITKGIVSVFSGIGFTTFLYYLSTALVLKLPPDIVAQVPFEIDPVVKVLWLFGLVPTLSGLGHILAGLLIKPKNHEAMQIEEPVREQQVEFPRTTAPAPSLNSVPRSVTEGTTNLLEETKVNSTAR